jgi:hypothetical protein
VGFRESRTDTSKLHVPVLPEASVAPQVTDVVPRGKEAPDGGVQVGLTGPQLSRACAEKVAWALPAAHSRTGAAGHETAGGVVSTMVTVAVHVALSRPSKAVRDTGWLPRV